MNKADTEQLFRHMPVLNTERLLLRKMLQKDTNDMYEYASRADVTEYLTWSPHISPAATEEYLCSLDALYREGRFYDWALIIRESGKMIGTCGFTSFDYANNSAEIGYAMNPAFWGNGYMREAALAVMGFGFSEMLLHRIEAKYIIGNERSRKLMENCGMTYEGIHRSSMLIKGEYRDIGVCSVLYEEFAHNFGNTQTYRRKKGWFGL